MKVYIRYSSVLLLIMAVLLAAGCGKTNDRFTTERNGDVTTEGMLFCYQCHNDTDNPAGLATVFGNSPASIANSIGWLAGAHANNETAGPGAYPDHSGVPPYAWFDGSCAQCHDQLGDGRSLDDYYAETGDDTLGRVERPVIGCESCHGSGNGHMSVAKPGPDECEQCHNAKFPHSDAEGVSIPAKYKSSPHANSTVVFGFSICSRCHTNEGARAYIGLVNGTEDASDISFALNPQDDIEDPTPVQCATCHEAHTLELLGELSDAGDGTWSTQFKTCTSCHQLYDETGALHEAYHSTWAPDVLITDTHYDDPATSEIEGYIINTTIDHSSDEDNSNGGTCLDCHNPHDADNTINRQWANSAHGGFILQTVDPATGIGNVTSAVAPGWTQLDFKNVSCARRCHTSSIFRNLANDPALYNSSIDQFTASGEQREMLYCWACHIDNVGSFRNPGIFNTTISPYSQPADRINAVGDLNGSNLCMPCHSGRRTGDSAVKNPSSPINFTNTSPGSPHHLLAGGILFNTIGYEYDGLNYANPFFFEHRYIGLDGEPGGENGPCVGCHMSAEASGHTLNVVEKDEFGVITEITAIEVCNNCHFPSPFSDYWTPEELEAEAVGFANAASALDILITTVRSGCTSSDWTCPYPETGSDEPEKSLGAGFNNLVMGEDPGAFAHNSRYTKRLIFDSYDWMDNGIINGTIDLSSYPEAAEWYQGDGGNAADDNAVTRP